MIDTKYEVEDWKLVIPDGVTEINKDSIDGYLGSVKELVIPKSVLKIAEGVFKDCFNLEMITLPTRFVSSFDKIFQHNYNINNIVFIGDAQNLDFSSWSWGNGYTESIYSKIFKHHKPTIVIDGEIKHLTVGAKFFSRNGNISQYKFFINNYIEDVDVQGTDKWTDEDLFFLSPKFKKNIVEGNVLNLTLCPRSTFYDDKRWSAPIAVKADAVTYAYPKPLQCYDDEYEGCRLLLLGNRLEEIAIDDFSRMDGYPYIDVWERYDIVLNALRNAGWDMK